MKFNLEFPVSCAGSLIYAVMVRKPTLDDLESAAPGFLSSAATRVNIANEPSLALLARLTDLPVEIVGELDFADFRALCDLVGGAMGELVDQERGKRQCRKLRKIRPLRVA